MELHKNVATTYQKLFIIVLLIGLLICSFIILRQYCRNQVYVSTSFIKKCDISKNLNKRFLNIVSIINGSKNIQLTLNKLEPLDYNGIELIESYFYRGDINNIPTFGAIPKNIKSSFQKIKGSRLSKNIKDEYDCVIWVFKIIDPSPKLPKSKKCEVKYRGIPISRINQITSRLK